MTLVPHTPRRPKRCPRCRGARWICEEHPDRPWPHERCPGPGDPCPLCNTGEPPVLSPGFRSILVLCVVCVLGAACGSSSPTTPGTTTTTIPPVPTPPPTVQIIQVSGCPSSGPSDLAFYQQIGCNLFELPAQPVRRWTIAPKVYLRTVDDAGAAIDGVTLDTVQNAMIETAMAWTAGHFGLEGVLRGNDTREGVSGWITVKWPATAAAAPACGRSQVATDGGWIELNYKVTACACSGSAIRPRTARHELGHAFGYFHTDSPSDLMSGQQVSGCDASPSARELQAAAYHYR